MLWDWKERSNYGSVRRACSNRLGEMHIGDSRHGALVGREFIHVNSRRVVEVFVKVDGRAHVIPDINI